MVELSTFVLTVSEYEWYSLGRAAGTQPLYQCDSYLNRQWPLSILVCLVHQPSKALHSGPAGCYCSVGTGPGLLSLESVEAVCFLFAVLSFLYGGNKLARLKNS